MDALVLAAFALLALGMVGSIVPLLPSGLAATAGVLLYWWHVGRPGPLLLAVLVLLGLTATAVDWFGGPLAGYAGGASTKTTIIAGIVGLLLIPLGGPIGIIIGIAGTIFVLEYRRHGDHERSLETAAYATVGVLASAVVQLLFTGVMFGVMLYVHLA